MKPGTGFSFKRFHKPSTTEWLWFSGLRVRINIALLSLALFDYYDDLINIMTIVTVIILKKIATLLHAIISRLLRAR